MRPRKFYVGFPPAIVKTTRNGIEYGIGAIPLGGYVRIPGMHRPAAKDVDHVFARALHAAPELTGPAERLKRSLAAEDYETAKVRLAEFHEAAQESGVKSVDKQVLDLEDALVAAGLLARADLEARGRDRRRPVHEHGLRRRRVRGRVRGRRRQGDHLGRSGSSPPRTAGRRPRSSRG